MTTLPDDLHVTTKVVAEYYGVGYNNAITPVVARHRDELLSDGMKVLRGDELHDYKIE